MFGRLAYRENGNDEYTYYPGGGIFRMIQFCRLKSNIKICKIYQIGVEDSYIILGKRRDGIVDIIQIDGCESYPLKYTSTWEENIVLFDEEKNLLYNSNDKPVIIHRDENEVEMSYRGRLYKFKYDPQMVYQKGSKIIVTDPDSEYHMEKGIIIDVIADKEFLAKNDYLPRYQVLLNSNLKVFLDDYQITIEYI